MTKTFKGYSVNIIQSFHITRQPNCLSETSHTEPILASIKNISEHPTIKNIKHRVSNSGGKFTPE